MAITDIIQIECECGNKFRFEPRQKFNSTIKPKAPTKCQLCINKEILTKKPREGRKFNSTIPQGKYTTKPKIIKTGQRKRTKWTDKPHNKLIQHVQDFFCNPYIRERDKILFKKCISCSGRITQAGHRYSIGDFPGMRLLINNVHGQEINCNSFHNGNVKQFDSGLVERYGQKYLDDLKAVATAYQETHIKLSRMDLIEIGLTYKYLYKKKLLISTQKEFDLYRDIANQNYSGGI